MFQDRASVRILDTMTTLLMPAAFAASINLHVPTLSTLCASSFILKGLPGINPRAIIRESAPSNVLAISSTLSMTTSKCLSATDEVSTLETFWTMAPRTTVEDSERVFVAFSMLRTPPITSRLGLEARRSRTLLPVWPVEPATTTFLTSTALLFGVVKKVDAVTAAVENATLLNNSLRLKLESPYSACNAVDIFCVMSGEKEREDVEERSRIIEDTTRIMESRSLKK